MKNKKYKVPILTNYKSINDLEQFKKDATKQGLKSLLSFYNKNITDNNINKLLSYFKFAEFEDFYVKLL